MTSEVGSQDTQLKSLFYRLGAVKIMKHVVLNGARLWRSIMLATTIAIVALSVANVPILAQGGKKALPNIVLVHGAWADGSSWSAVIQRLQKDGYKVTAPQFPMTTLADNDARLREVLNVQTGPTIVVGHSYGGQIITGLGKNAPNVVGLGSIAAFRPAERESLQELLFPGPPTPAIAPPVI